MKRRHRSSLWRDRRSIERARGASRRRINRHPRRIRPGAARKPRYAVASHVSFSDRSALKNCFIWNYPGIPGI
jgi:hypothetical protein